MLWLCTVLSEKKLVEFLDLLEPDYFYMFRSKKWKAENEKVH